MYPRFSLKWLLIAFTILGVAFYIAFVRPTVIAKRFVAAVERRDFSQLVDLTSKKRNEGFGRGLKAVWERSPDRVQLKADILPQTWTDIFRFQRRIDLTSTIKKDEHRLRDTSGSLLIVAQMWSVEVRPWQYHYIYDIY
jgi:hypothetical protein